MMVIEGQLILSTEMVEGKVIVSRELRIGPHAQEVITSNTVNVEDLASLPLDELAGRANEAASQAEDWSSATVEAAIRCGMALIAAKEKVGHGKWLVWLAANFEKDRGTARRYMTLANGARAPHLTNSNSIRDALRLISGPKEGTKEAKEEERESAAEATETQVIEMLRAGKGICETSKSTKCSQSRVSNLYHSVVVPELCQIDWKREVLKHKVKEVAAIKQMHVIQADCIANQRKGGVLKYAAETLGITTTNLDRAKRVIKYGCSQLVQRMTEGEITIGAAEKIAMVPVADQEVLLRSMERQDAVDAVDDLRSRVSTMRDQEFGWTRKYGDGKRAFVDLCREAERTEVEEIIGQMKQVRKWVDSVILFLEVELCSQSTEEPSNS